MFCQIRIWDVLRLIKFQFYGLAEPYEQFVSADLFPRTMHLEIPYGCSGIREFLVSVFVSTSSGWRWQRLVAVSTRPNAPHRTESIKTEILSPVCKVPNFEIDTWCNLLLLKRIHHGTFDNLKLKHLSTVRTAFTNGWLRTWSCQRRPSWTSVWISGRDNFKCPVLVVKVLILILRNPSSESPVVPSKMEWSRPASEPQSMMINMTYLAGPKLGKNLSPRMHTWMTANWSSLKLVKTI